METDIWNEICGGLRDHEVNDYSFSTENLKKSAFGKPSRIKFFIRKLLSLVSCIAARLRREKTIALLIGDNQALCEYLATRFNLYIINPSRRQIKYCIKNRMPFETPNIHNSEYFKHLYYGHDSRDIEKEIRRIRIRLKKFKCKFMLVPDDVEMLFRLYLYAARLENIKSATILHGIMGEQKAIVGTYSDWMFLWGEHYKNYYDEKFNIEKNIVMGYPYYVKRDSEIVENEKKVLFVGQPLEEDKEVVKLVYKVCEELGLELCYRFHPGENKKKKIREEHIGLENMKYSSGELADELLEAGIVIGLVSTVLMEALIYGKASVQVDALKDKKLDVDFSDIGTVIKVKCDYEAIKNVLSNVKRGAYYLNSNYLYINENYFKDVADFIDEHSD